jgi:hypothetical protein
MFIKIASTTDPQYDYNLGLAVRAGKATILEMEIANTGSVNSESGTAFMRKLLDGQHIELPVQRFKTQKIITLPNLLLAGFEFKFGTITGVISYKDLLEQWWYARSRWIRTDELQNSESDFKTQGLVKVVRGTEKLDYEQVNNVTWAQRTAFDVITAGVYG